MMESQPKIPTGRFVSAVRAGFGFAILALAALFLWQLSADYARQETEARRYSDLYRDDAAARLARACPDRNAANFHVCAAAQIQATREDQRAEHNLNVQRQLSNWAFWMLVASMLALALTAITLWFVKGTLDATRATVAEAERATAAAQGALKVSQDTAVRQLRAYVFPEDAVIKEKGDAWAVTVRIRNAGVTPAEHLVCNMDVRYVEFPIPRDHPPYREDALVYAFMPPGSERTISVEGLAISDGEMAKIRRSEAGIYCRCTIAYTSLGERIEIPDTEGVATGSDVDDGVIRGVPPFIYDDPPPDDEGQGQLNLLPS